MFGLPGVLTHEEGHARAFGTGYYLHSEFPNHIMYAETKVWIPPGEFEARCYARIISMKDGARALEVLWDEYEK